MGFMHYFASTDAVGLLVAAVLLLMSVVSWVIILLKAWVLYKAQAALPRAIAAFWQAQNTESGVAAVQAFDTQGWLRPLLGAVSEPAPPGHSVGDATPSLRLARWTRLLREAKNDTLRQLSQGQTWLATVGATAPFVGLLGTVWGIYHALITIAGAGAISIDKVAGPVGESLVMTAAGLAVALPAVLAYNIFGRKIAYLGDKLDGFAYDLRELLGSQSPDLAP
jgi:biopolymer transport protein ExbB